MDDTLKIQIAVIKWHIIANITYFKNDLYCVHVRMHMLENLQIIHFKKQVTHMWVACDPMTNDIHEACKV